MLGVVEVAPGDDVLVGRAQLEVVLAAGIDAPYEALLMHAVLAEQGHGRLRDATVLIDTGIQQGLRIGRLQTQAPGATRILAQLEPTTHHNTPRTIRGCA
ncbi:hypothetical protein D3C80_1736930 [compost metagenome]